ncbi:Phospholipid-transporting ATPase 1 [Hordeum vulgare]|nr:Phospholipid-transporting ATPase 1 [Hordeum vulgare]
MDGDLDLDLDAAVGLATLTSSDKGMSHASRKAAAPKPKKVLTVEQRAKELAKRKDRRHAAGARDEAITAATAQQQVTIARIAAAMREALCMLGLNPSQHDLVNAVVAAAVSTGSSAFPQTMLPDSPRALACNLVPSFHVYPRASRLSGECSPEVSVVAPSTPAPMTIDLNATPVAGGSSSGGTRKRVRYTPADQLSGARNLFDGMPAAGEDDYMQNMIFEGGRHRLDLDGFPLDHVFPEDYGLEEEDECDIEAEPLFEDELANQAEGRHRSARASGPRHTRRLRTSFFASVGETLGKTPRRVPNKSIQPFGFVFTVFQALEAFKVQHNGKCFNLSHCFRVIKDEEKFKAQYAGLKSRGGKQAVEEVGDGEKAWPRGKTNSKKEDKQDAASITLIAAVEGMITKKDSREEKHRQEREEQINAFLEIQRRRLDMEAEKQVRMLEIKAGKQAEMLEIVAANAKTKPKKWLSRA